MAYCEIVHQIIIIMINVVLALFLLQPPNGLNPIFLRPAIDVAFETVNNAVAEGLYLNFSMSYLYRETDSGCGRPVMTAPGIAADLHFNHDVDGFLGPPCSDETATVGDLAAYWNLPVVSGASTSTSLDDKQRYFTLTRTSFKTSVMTKAVLSMSARFGWHRLSMMRSYPSFFSLVYRAMEELSLSHNITVFDVPLTKNTNTRDALLEALTTSRS